MTEHVRPLVIYHAQCRDGFCAAWVADLYFRSSGLEAHYLPAMHGSPPPTDIEGRDVYILDFAYKRADMEQIQSKARKMVVLDHHKTAEEALQGLGPDVHFDLNRSGAGMTWDYFLGGPRPWQVNYVEDRDLWKHALRNSAEVNAYIGTLPFHFSMWATPAELTDTVPKGIVERGKMVLAKVAQYVAEASKNVLYINFHGYIVPIVNAPQVDISELLASLVRTPLPSGKLPKFSMGWRQRGDWMFEYSFRSVGDFDVSAIAKLYGGGGHRNAAGFSSTSMQHSYTKSFWEWMRAVVEDKDEYLTDPEIKAE